MTAVESPAWQHRAQQLADDLVAAGKLHDPRWYQAICAVPRHHLVPTYHHRDNGQWQQIPTDSGPGWDQIYTNTALMTRVDAHGWLPSSTSQPGLMTRMLEALDLADGHRVLEIGTGAGYNAALLCHQLGHDQVFSVDINPELVEAARHRLAELGYTPTLVTGDGADGLARHAPFDRIIATCAVNRIPWTWIEQLRNGGIVLADLKLAIGAGNLIRLEKISGNRAHGRFDTGYASFMAMRHTLENPATRATRAEHPTQRATDHPAIAWERVIPWFLAALTLPAAVSFGYRMPEGSDPTTTTVPTLASYTAADGSWCTVDATPNTGQRLVTEAGPTRIWQHIEHANHEWERLGKPGWDRFGLTVTPDAQTVWLDKPDSEHHWEL